MSAQLLTLEDLAAETREHVQTWRRRVRRREIPARRVGSPVNGKIVVTSEDFATWLANLPTVGNPS